MNHGLKIGLPLAALILALAVVAPAQVGLWVSTATGLTTSGTVAVTSGSASALAVTGGATVGGNAAITGTATVSGNGSTFATDQVGLVRYLFQNTNANNTSATIIDIGNNASGTAGEIVATSSAFSPSGPFLTNSVAYTSAQDGGLSISAGHASGDVRIYTGGNGTPRFTIDDAGDTTGVRIRSFTAQPGFLAYNSAQDILGSGIFTVDFDTEVYDTANNFSADTFTAPVTGIYDLCTHVMVAVSVTYALDIVTSNRNYIFTNASGTADPAMLCVPADFDAGDTAFVRVQFQTAGDLVKAGPGGDMWTWFSARLMP